MYPYFDVMVGHAWSYDPESYEYAGGSLATGRIYRAVQVKGYDPDKKGYIGPPDWGFGVGLTIPPRTTKQNQGLGSGNLECAVPI